MTNMRCLVPVVILVLAASSHAQTPEEEELARQEAFRLGMQDIVADLNAGSTDRFIASIDQNDIVDRIFGLKLIDQKVKMQFRDNLEFQYEPMIRSAFSNSKDTIRATLLGV